MEIKVIIADDHVIICEGLKSPLEKSGSFTIASRREGNKKYC